MPTNRTRPTAKPDLKSTLASKTKSAKPKAIKELQSSTKKAVKKAVTGKKKPVKSKIKTGRPLIEIDEGQVLTLAKIQCANKEIAAVVGCSLTTLERRFGELISNARLQGNASLRRKQFDVALKGNVTMLTWLGKNYLDQKDKHEVGGPDGAPVQYTQINVIPYSGDGLRSGAESSGGSSVIATVATPSLENT